MPLVDDHGRLFGKINLIDATLAAFVLLLIPLAYGAFLLFRLPPPRINSVSPVQVVPPVGRSVKDTVVQINGENLRPYLRAWHINRIRNARYMKDVIRRSQGPRA